MRTPWVRFLVCIFTYNNSLLYVSIQASLWPVVAGHIPEVLARSSVLSVSAERFCLCPGEIRATRRSITFENTAVPMLEYILSLPKTSEQNTSSRFPIVDTVTCDFPAHGRRNSIQPFSYLANR